MLFRDLFQNLPTYEYASKRSLEVVAIQFPLNYLQLEMKANCRSLNASTSFREKNQIRESITTVIYCQNKEDSCQKAGNRLPSARLWDILRPPCYKITNCVKNNNKTKKSIWKYQYKKCTLYLVYYLYCNCTAL